VNTTPNWSRVAALDAAMSSGDVRQLDGALAAHPNGNRGVERIHHDAGAALSHDTLRQERLRHFKEGYAPCDQEPEMPERWDAQN
jgi:hypothetical protein